MKKKKEDKEVKSRKPVQRSATDPAPEVIQPLSPEEQKRLTQLEENIQQKLADAMSIGLDLLAVQKEGLYRQEYASFEDYLEKKWGMSRAHAYRAIHAAKLISVLKGKSSVQLPCNEHQLRPLYRLQEKDVLRVWQGALKEAGEFAVPGELVKKHVDRFLADGGKQAEKPVSVSSKDANIYQNTLMERIKQMKKSAMQGDAKSVLHLVEEIRVCAEQLQRHEEQEPMDVLEDEDLS